MCENCQQQSCRAFIGLTIHAKMIGARRPFYLKFWVKVTAFERNRRFSIYFRPYRLSRNILQKSSINTIRKFTTRFPMSPRRTPYVVPKPPPKVGSKTRSVQNLNNKQRYEIGCQLLLLTNRKSHTWFRLVLTSMTLNDL